MKILVLNCGSSTLKFQLIETAAKRRISGADSRLKALVVHTNEELIIARETARLTRP